MSHAHNLGTDPEIIRNLYAEAIEDDLKADKGIRLLGRIKEKTSLLMAYEGAFEALQAKHAWNPYVKLAKVKKANQILERAIEKAPENIEIRFLRYSINFYLPGFLRSGADLAADRKVIVAAAMAGEFQPLPLPVKKTIINFMIDNDIQSEEEKKCFEHLAATISQ